MKTKVKLKGQDDLTVKLLAELGNSKPSQQQVRLAKSLLLRASTILVSTLPGWSILISMNIGISGLIRSILRSAKRHLNIL